MTILIKTYLDDLKWLKHCLKSIAKYASGFDVVIIADANCQPELSGWNLTQEKVIYVNPTYEGYLFQQEIKLRAFEFTDSEYILFMDCDCIFTDFVTPEFFLTDGNPNLLKTPYEDIPEVMFWKTATEDAIGFEVEFEFMRRNSLVYRRSTLIDLWNTYSTRFLPKLRTAKNRAFSEFNLMGAYVQKFERDKYNIINTRDEIPYHPVRQFWSYSGLSKDDLKEINQHL